MKNQLPDFSKWYQLARQFLGEDFFKEMTNESFNKTPYADVYEGKNEVIVVMDLPGMENINSLDIRIEGETLLIKGYVPSPYQSYRTISTERKSGEFQKTISLGTPVSPKFSSARYRKGVLEIRFPRLKPSQRLRVHATD